MTALVVAIALVVGVIVSEVLVRCLGKGAWAVRRLASARHELQSFHAADNDDARQAHLIRGGMATLTVSLAALAVIAAIAAIFAAPMFALAWDDPQSILYFVVSGIVAIGWWMMRRPRRGA